MRENSFPLKLRLKVILNGLKQVFSYPSYLVLAFLGMLIGLGAALWALNLDVLKFVLFESGVETALKIEFFLSVYQTLFAEVANLQSLVLVVFGILFGINIAVLVYVLKRRFKQKKSLKGSSSSMGGLVLATIGGGCAACGASILTPLLATLGVTSIGLVRNIGIVAALLGIILISYSIVKLSEQAASLRKQ